MMPAGSGLCNLNAHKRKVGNFAVLLCCLYIIEFG